MLDLNYIYKSKYKIVKKKNRKFKSFKHVISLKDFKKKHMKSFYTPKEMTRLRKFLNIGPYLMRRALIQRNLLHKFFKFKYRAIYFPLKILPRKLRCPKRVYMYFRKKKKKKNINLRFHHFFKINYDNFLLYLTIFDKKLIIKPFNFLGSLFFYKTRTFKKPFILARRFKFSYANFRKFKYRRFKKKRKRLKRFFRCRRLKRKFLLKRFHKLKIRSAFNFFRFIAFLNICKKINLNNDDSFKIKSISVLPYKLLKFNFNKLTNSYNFFFNFKKKKKSKLSQIKFNNNGNNNFLNKEKNKLYKLIKLNLKNRKFFKNNINLSIFNNNNEITKNDFVKNNGYHIFYFLIQKLLCEYKLLYKINANNLKLTINSSFDSFKEFNTNNKKFITNTINVSELLKLNKSIRKIFKKLIYFEKIIMIIKQKRKNKLSKLFLNNFNKKSINKNKITKKINNYNNKYKKVLDNLFYIINILQVKFEKLFLNFNIFFFNYRNNKFNNNNSVFTLLGLKQEKEYLTKIQLFLKKKNNLKLPSNGNDFFSLKINNQHGLFSKNKKFLFSYKNKINNDDLARMGWFKKNKFRKRFVKKKKKKILRQVFKFFNLKTLVLYKNLSKNNYFYGKKLKFLSLNLLKHMNIKNSTFKQTTKNINFLNVN